MTFMWRRTERSIFTHCKLTWKGNKAMPVFTSWRYDQMSAVHWRQSYKAYSLQMLLGIWSSVRNVFPEIFMVQTEVYEFGLLWRLCLPLKHAVEGGIWSCFCLAACIYPHHRLHHALSKSMSGRQANSRTNIFPLTLTGLAALSNRRGIRALSSFSHLMGEIQINTSELKAAVNEPLKANDTGHQPRGHSTVSALFRFIFF